jgi:A/G-specific adenine glycosylase
MPEARKLSAVSVDLTDNQVTRPSMRSSGDRSSGSAPVPGLSSIQITRTRRRLVRWGRSNYRDYPWRNETDPWLSLLAELLLQRTRASQVVPVFERIRREYPKPNDLAQLSPTEARNLVGSLGLQSRGPALVEIAAEVVRKRGQLPENESELRRLVGVGEYTARAWLSLHRGQRATIIDSNVVRWLSRMTGGPYNRDPRGISWVQRLADQITPQRVFRDYNYAVLDFTMTVCTPKKPSCKTCPVRSDCWTRQRGDQT